MTIHESLNNIEPNRDVIPSSCMTFSENAQYVVEYSNKVFFETFKAIGIDELVTFEALKEEVIYEGAKLDALKNKVISIFQKILAAIKAAYEKVVAFFMSKSSNFKAAIKRISKDQLEDLPVTKTFGNIHEYKLDSFKTDVVSKANDLANKISSEWDKISTADKESINDLRDRLNDEIEKELGIDKESSFDAKVVSVDQGYAVEHFNDLIKYALGESNKKEISDVYKTEKATIEGIIKNINKTKSGEEAIIAAKANNFRTLSNALHKATSKYNDILRRQFVESMMVLTRINKAIEANEAKEEAVANYNAYAKSINESNQSFIDVCDNYIFND